MKLAKKWISRAGSSATGAREIIWGQIRLLQPFWPLRNLNFKDPRFGSSSKELGLRETDIIVKTQVNNDLN